MVRLWKGMFRDGESLREFVDGLIEEDHPAADALIAFLKHGMIFTDLGNLIISQSLLKKVFEAPSGEPHEQKAKCSALLIISRGEARETLICEYSSFPSVSVVASLEILTAALNVLRKQDPERAHVLKANMRDALLGRRPPSLRTEDLEGYA
ncbi:hypothetical protein DRO48_01265 [Candidatus Bathyarchaeota archaeon]|nr:MAG: hypothetical protein DRO48_01265 [Candidatus Bathyarchaeota archaeon]